MLPLTATLLAPLCGASPIAEAWALAPGPAERVQLAALGASFAEGVDGPWVRIHARPGDLQRLRDAGLTLRGERGDHRLVAAPARYHTPEEMSERLRSLAEEHADRAALVRLGVSLQGRPIDALRLGVEGGVAWRILGAHHGDELSSAELALAVAEALLDDDQRFPGVLDEGAVWIAPHVNPDGVAAGSRYNARDVDLNRNYDYQWSPLEAFAGERPFSEPETRAVRTLSLWVPFTAGLSMHSGAENIGYVWNYDTEDSVEEGRLEGLAATYADACGLEDLWVTNGAAWYVTYGDTNDWSFGRRGALDFTLEISNAKTPPEQDLPAYLDAHLPAVAAWLAAPVALSGAVLEAETGRPLEASLSIVGETVDFPSDPVTGAFARVIEPGAWTLRAAAPGYTTVEVPLEIPDAAKGDSAARVELALSPEGRRALRPEPALLSKGEPTIDLRLPALEAPDQLTLWRPGVPDVHLDRVGDAWPVETGDLAPGLWGLAWVEGGAARASPRALFVGYDDDSARLDAVWGDEGGERLFLEGAGFAEGARAYAVWGEDRALEPLAVLSLAPDLIELDADALPASAAPVDLLLVTAGAELAALDVRGEALVDRGAPDASVGDTGAARLAGASSAGCACGASAAPPTALLPPLSLLCLFARRRTA